MLQDSDLDPLAELKLDVFAVVMTDDLKELVVEMLAIEDRGEEQKLPFYEDGTVLSFGVLCGKPRTGSHSLRGSPTNTSA